MNSRIIYRGYVTLEIIESKFEVVHVPDSVAIFVFDPVLDLVLFVEQARFPVVSESNPTGRIREFVAGRLDKKGLDPIEIAQIELKEEAGLTVPTNDIHLLNGGEPLALSPGVLTEHTYIAFAMTSLVEYVNRIGVSFGNAEEGEKTYPFVVPVAELGSMTFHSMTTFALVQWFRNELLEAVAGRVNKWRKK